MKPPSSPPNAHFEESAATTVDSKTPTPTNLDSNGIIPIAAGLQTQQQQQQPIIMYHNHRPVSMESLHPLLMANSNLFLPFHRQQEMTMMAAARFSSSPRNDGRNFLVASQENNHESSNLNNLLALSNECASSDRSASYPHNGVFLQTNQVNFTAVDSVQSKAASCPSMDLTSFSRDNSLNAWLDQNYNIGVGDDRYVAEHGSSKDKDRDCVVLSSASSTPIDDVALNAVATEVKSCGEELNNNVAQSNIDFDAFIDRYFPSEC